MNIITKFILLVSTLLVIYLLLYLTEFIFMIWSEYWIDKIETSLWLLLMFLFVVEIIHLNNSPLC